MFFLKVRQQEQKNYFPISEQPLKCLWNVGHSNLSLFSLSTTGLIYSSDLCQQVATANSDCYMLWSWSRHWLSSSSTKQVIRYSAFVKLWWDEQACNQATATRHLVNYPPVVKMHFQPSRTEYLQTNDPHLRRENQTNSPTAVPVQFST